MKIGVNIKGFSISIIKVHKGLSTTKQSVKEKPFCMKCL